MSEKKLTDKQRRFVEEYTVDFNATQAAIRAGYSKASANPTGSENLAKPSIREAIDKRLDALSCSTAEVLTRLSEIGRKVHADPDIRPEHSLSALDKILRARGAYVDRKEISGPGGKDFVLEIVNKPHE